MQEILVAMAIMGCGDAGSSCETLRIMEPDFASVAECHAAAPGILGRLSDLDYPVVQVECGGRTELAAEAGAGKLS